MKGLSTFLAFALLASAAPVAAQTVQPKMKMPASSGESASAKAFTAANQRMMSDMNTQPTGDADKDFVTMMIPHHQGAIDMAKVELKFGRDPMLRKMAEVMIRSQEREIEQMRSWSAKHGG